MEKKSRRELSPGDTIRVGSSVFVFEVFHPHHPALQQKWNNETSVIPRASFKFEDLSMIKPDKLLPVKRRLRSFLRSLSVLERMCVKEFKLWMLKGELSLTKVFHRVSKKLSSIKFLKH